MLNYIRQIIPSKWLRYIEVSSVYIVAILFVLMNSYFISKEKYYLALLPLGVVVLYFAFFYLDKFLLFTIFLVPLSIPLSELIPNLPINMFLPTEPILVGILILFLWKLAADGSFDRRIINHPISILILLNVLWIFITSITSTMPEVSFKFLLARIWFVVAFYFLGTQLFKSLTNMRRFMWLYIGGLIIVIIYTINRHLGYGLFDQEAANFVVSPFYNDHTSYGAMLAMFLPVFIGFGVHSNYKFNMKLMVWLVVAILLFALAFSYTRAAWVSLVGVIGIYFVILFKIKFRTFLLMLATLIGLFVVYSTVIFQKMEKNDQDSSTNFNEHIQSISNISTDASNLERLNRWASALRMFSKKPVFGFGPGTYQFQYAPFQKEKEKTIISTNFGDGGNAHSEYLGPLSESGLLGSISILLIVFFTIYYGLKVYKEARTPEIKTLALTILLGLISYFLHGILNNFLDTDKASAPVWGFIAMLVALDVYHNKEKQAE